MISANSGIEAATDGLTELKGSNDTVTKCRFATAKVTKIRPSRIKNSVLKNFRMTIARVDQPAAASCKPGGHGLRPQLARTLASRLGVLAVQPLAHFLAGLEERHALLIDRDVGAGARVAPGP